MMLELTGFSCVFMRMTGCILFNPILGRRNFPSMFRAAFIVMLTLLVMSYSGVRVTPPADVFGNAIMLFSELFIGFVMGFVVNLFTYTLIFAGEFIDLQMGMSMSKVYDPQSNISMSLTTTYFNILYLLLFFALNGHLTMLRLFLGASEAIPYGEAVISSTISQPMLDAFILCTELGVKLALPMIAIQFLMEMGVGILMKAIPQINVFVVSLQSKVLVGLLVLVLISSPVGGFIDSMIVTMFDALQEVVELL